MYKSNWYKKIQENDPTETFKLEEEKKKRWSFLGGLNQAWTGQFKK